MKELKYFIGKYFPLSDKMYIKILFFLRFKKNINFKNPKSFNEKLNYLKLYDRNEEYSLYADKNEVKKIVENKIGKEYIIKTLGIYEKFSDIDFSKLPNKFVIKCTHDSGSTIVCKNKNAFDIKNAELQINSSIKKNYFYYLREWPYKNIKPRIIVEEYIGNGKEVKDYKFWCFNGKPLYIYETIKNDNIFENFYDINLRKANIAHNFNSDNKPKADIKNYNIMLEIVKKLCEKIPFIRIDLYNIDGKIYFGEYTFYDWGGFKKFDNENTDFELGKLIDINTPILLNRKEIEYRKTLKYKFKYFFSNFFEIVKELNFLKIINSIKYVFLGSGKELKEEVVKYNDYKNKKIVVYSSVVGKYDDIMEPIYKSKNIDYIMFTENDIKSKVWKIKNFPKEALKYDNPILVNRYIKMNPCKIFKDYDYSIYIDGNILPVSDIDELINYVSHLGLAFHRHPLRNNIFKEAKACIYQGRGNKFYLEKQINEYKNNGYNMNGLIEANVIVTDLKNKKAEKIYDEWFKEFIKSKSNRDQISLPYVIWKLGYNITEIGNLGKGVINNPKFKIVKHKKKGKYEK